MFFHSLFICFKNTMWYTGDFKIRKVGILSDSTNTNAFSLILNGNKKIYGLLTKYQFTNAAKPLMFFTSLFGIRMIRYHKFDISKVKSISKIYCFSIVGVIITLLAYVKPVSWIDTKSDIPLNILTKAYGLLTVLEVTYSIFIASFGNSVHYVKFFNTIDDIDCHFGTSKGTFIKGRLAAWMFILIPILQVSSTFLLRKFHVNNSGSHLIFFLLVLQGSVIVFFIISIYLKLIILNMLLVKKIMMGLTTEKKYVLEDSWKLICFKVSLYCKLYFLI